MQHVYTFLTFAIQITHTHTQKHYKCELLTQGLYILCTWWGEMKLKLTWVRGQMKFVWLCVTAMSSSSSSSSFSAAVCPAAYTYAQKYIHCITYNMWKIQQQGVSSSPCMAYFLTLSLKETTLLCLCSSASVTPAISSVKRSFTEFLRLTMASEGSCLTYGTYERMSRWLSGRLDKDFVPKWSNKPEQWSHQQTPQNNWFLCPIWSTP